MADLSGQQFGDYRLLRQLGSGTFGEVYEDEQIYLRTHVAIKVLHAQLGQTEVEHFLKEARTIASLEHPHIVRVLSFSIQQQIPYLVMQLAQGSLKECFASGHPQSVETILPYLQQVAEGLQHAHNQHVMHLDIKPANLLLTRGDQVLLADFGIAIALQTLRGK
jgi:eukaryotic-like serine/threonine-protein kinase